MTGKTAQLIIVGTGEFGQIAYEYFTFDSYYEVVGFAVESKYKDKDKLYEKPVVEFERIKEYYPPEKYDVFVAITYPKLNRARTRIFHQVKEMGYHCASYISSHAFVWHNVEIGENTFIFEDNTIQFHAKIGDNVILWSGNHIGHGSVIEDHCWFTSHDVISGFCHVGKSCFIGVNVSVGDRVTIAEDVVLGAGSVTVKDLPEKGRVYIGSPAKPINKTSYEQFHVKGED